MLFLRMKSQIWVELSFWAIYVFWGAQIKVICVLKIKNSYSKQRVTTNIKLVITFLPRQPIMFESRY